MNCNLISLVSWRFPRAGKKYKSRSLAPSRSISLAIARKSVNLIPNLLALSTWKPYIKWISMFGKFMIRNGKSSAREINLNVRYLLIVRRWFFICIWKHFRVVLICCSLIFRLRGGCSFVSLGFLIRGLLMLWNRIWKSDIKCLMSFMRGLIEPKKMKKVLAKIMEKCVLWKFIIFIIYNIK